MENDGRFVTTSEAARILGMSHNHVLKSAEHALHQRGGPGRPNYYWAHKIRSMRAARDRNLCQVCGVQPTKSPVFATCGHPRCVKDRRRSARAVAKMQEHSQGAAITEAARIRQTWTELAGLPHGMRVMKTAERNRVNMATVLGVVREVA